MPTLTTHQEQLISLLLASFPAFQSGDAEAAVAAYALVIADAMPQDVEPGIRILLNGQYPGHDGRFAPSAPILASAIRMAMERRIDRERMARKPMLPPPDIEKTDESRERVRKMTEQVVKQLGEAMLTDDAADIKRRSEFWGNVNDRNTAA